MADQQFRAIISVLDKATAPLRAIQSKIKDLARPVQHLGLSLAEVGRAAGINKIAHAAAHAGEKVRELGKQIGELLEPLGLIGGAASVVGLVELTRKTSEYGAALYDASIKTGVSAQALAQFHFAASLTGTSAESLDKGLTKLNRTIFDAASGKNHDAASMFAALHISLRDASGQMKTAAQIAPDLAEAIAKNGNAALRTKISTLAMGRAGAELLPLFSKGRDGLAEMGDEAERYGLVMSDGGVKAAKQFEDSQKTLLASVQGLGISIGEKLFPVINPMIDALRDWIAGNREWIASDIGDFVKRLGDYVRAINWQPIVSGVKSFAHGLDSVVKFLGPVGSGVVILGAILAPVIASLVAIGTAFVSLAGFIALTPIGWIIGGLVLIGAGAYELWKHWDEVWKAIVGAATWAWEKIKPIVDALKGAAHFFGNAFSKGIEAPGGMVDPNSGVFIPMPAQPQQNGASGSWADPGNDNAPLPIGGNVVPLAPKRPGLYGPNGAANMPAAAPVDGQINATIRFENVPPGTRISTSSGGAVAAPDTDIGYAQALNAF